MSYMFKKDWRFIYLDGQYRDYFVGSFADGLKSDIIKELIRRRYLMPLQNKIRYETKQLHIQSS